MATKYGQFSKAIQAEIDKDRRMSKDHGWDFKLRGVQSHTIGDFIRATMAIDNESDARAFYEGYLAFMTDKFKTEPTEGYTPERVVKANIGWCYGEGMGHERVAMWVKVCGAEHPVFGGALPATPQDAFRAGVQAATAAHAHEGGI